MEVFSNLIDRSRGIIWVTIARLLGASDRYYLDINCVLNYCKFRLGIYLEPLRGNLPKYFVNHCKKGNYD